MSKTILIMDMPSSCIKCPCCNIGSFYDICRVLNKTTNCSDNEKPTWCPLKPMPSRFNEEHFNRYEDGYNACIDELLSEKE